MPGIKGSGNCFAKLRAFQVRRIRALRGKLSSYAVGERYGISHTHVQRIWRREKWRHLK